MPQSDAMLGLAILCALLGFGFIVGYATRGIVSRKRRTEYLAHAPYFELPHSTEARQEAANDTAKQPKRSAATTLLLVVDRLGFALALDLALVLLVILLLPSMR